MTACLFCRIIKREIPANIVYEDEDTIAFLDIKPVRPGHTLVVPKVHSDDFAGIDPVDREATMAAVQRVARALLQHGAEGTNVHVNIKPAAGQVIFHTHVHVIPRHEKDGLHLWPHHEYAEGEAAHWHKTLLAALSHKPL